MYKIIPLLIFALLASSCNKSIEEPKQELVYDYSSQDDNGGSWDAILLTSGNEIPLADPGPIPQSEIDLSISENGGLSNNQKDKIAYWGVNSLVRWNYIARELAAKYNIPPAANPDGTYPVPSAANPGAYPNFPFANPPYVSRAFAYWSAAQFDAMIAAYYYKKAYGYQAPYTNASIQAQLPKNGLPSFPSEDAVIAAVSRDILTAMFPLEKDYLAAMAKECTDVRKWAGMNYQRDIVAGDALGKAVAAKFLARSRTDGMSRAGGNAAKWDSLATAAKTKFGWNWVSLESPKRPPMLPFFGQIKPWCIPSALAVRPSPPPAVNTEQFKKEVDELKNFNNNVTESVRKIANFWADGPLTYTPPGHWNRIGAEAILENKLNPIRTARTFAYLNMSLMDAAISCWDTKYYYHTPRPATVISGFDPLIGTPNFPGYTSGHSTFSGAGASVLSHIFPSSASKFEQYAKEASESRIYGGIHFRVDCEIGLQVGKTIGEFSNAVAKVDGAE
jgi:hypothetical protein